MNNTFSDRIETIISTKGINKAEFAKELGISQAYVSQICSGVRMPSDRTVADICRKFGVREEWLREGKFPMFQPVSRSKAIKEFVDEAMAAESSDFRQRLLNVLARLDTKEWELLESMALKLAAEATAPRPNILKIAGRDGSYQEHALTDDEKEAFMKHLDSLPDASDDL